MSEILKYFIVGLLLTTSVYSQVNDTISTEKNNKKLIYGEARKATIISAIIPGGGQIYNKKYWKAPIIYAGLAGFGYMFVVNNTEYKYYSKNLKAEYDNDPTTLNETGYSGTNLQDLKTTYRKRRDLGVIGCLVIYALNIIDANVDAHLKTFDVSDDLSLEIKPYNNLCCLNNSYKLQTGLTLNFKFH